MATPTTHTPGAALVTGASSGIGLYLTRELARHGHPVYIVAPDEVELQRVASVLSAEDAAPEDRKHRRGDEELAAEAKRA